MASSTMKRGTDGYRASTSPATMYNEELGTRDMVELGVELSFYWASSSKYCLLSLQNFWKRKLQKSRLMG